MRVESWVSHGLHDRDKCIVGWEYGHASNMTIGNPGTEWMLSLESNLWMVDFPAMFDYQRINPRQTDELLQVSATQLVMKIHQDALEHFFHVHRCHAPICRPWLHPFLGGPP